MFHLHGLVHPIIISGTVIYTAFIVFSASCICLVWQTSCTLSWNYFISLIILFCIISMYKLLLIKIVMYGRR